MTEETAVLDALNDDERLFLAAVLTIEKSHLHESSYNGVDELYREVEKYFNNVD